MKKIQFFAQTTAILFLCVFSIACTEKKLETGEILNISQILMHEKGLFTFIVDIPTTTESIRIQIGSCDKCFRIFRDAGNKNIWIKYTNTKHDAFDVDPNNTGYYRASSVEIHLHSTKEINGAGWNHGKFGRGQTVVIE